MNWKRVLTVVAIFCASLSADEIKQLPPAVQKGVELVGMISVLATDPKKLQDKENGSN